MISGKAGIKYGLQLNTKSALPKQAKKAPAPLAPSIFDDDEVEDIEAEIARQASKQRSKKEVEMQHAEALKQDALVFDYDSHFDEMNAAKKGAAQKATVQRESKYIGRLVAKAKEREKEQDILYERKLSKEREKEDHLYGDKDKFVTRAYKEKLAEEAKWLAQEKRLEAKEEANDVTKKSDMTDFYKNLWKQQNSTEQENGAPPEPTKGSNEIIFANDAPMRSVKEEDILDGGSDTPPTKESNKNNVSDANENQKSREVEKEATNISPPLTSGLDAPTLETTSRPLEVKQEEMVDAFIEKKVIIDPVAAAKERYLARKKQKTSGS